MAENAQDTVITYAGEIVGNVDSWEFQTGQIREATHRPLNGAPAARPTTPDFGTVVLNLYRDTSDAGQAAILASLRSRSIDTMTIAHPDGNTDTFSAFTQLYPIRGSRNGSDPVSTIRCVMRIDGDMV